MKLYKWTFFLTSISLWISAVLLYMLIGRGELQTEDTTDMLYQMTYLPMGTSYFFACSLDLLVIWSFHKLNKKVSAQMASRVTANLSTSAESKQARLEASRRAAAWRELDY